MTEVQSNASRIWQGVLRFLAIPTAVAAVICLVARLPYLWDMPGLDATQYLTAAQGWADGLVPYKDLFAEKGPLVYIFLLGLQEIAPRSIVGVHLAFMVVIIVSAALLASFVGRHTNRRVAWWTAVIYALLASSSLWELNDVNTEQLGLPFMVAAVDLADRYGIGGRWWHAAGAGAALAACFWVKPSVAFVGPLILALLILRPDRRLIGIVAAGGGAVLISAAILAPYAAAHALDAFRFSQSTYNHEYVTRGFDNLRARPFDDQVSWIFNLPSSGVFVAGLALGALAWVLGRHRRLVAIGTSWLLLEYAGAKFGVRDFAHYFVPMLPPCALLIVIGGDALASHLTGIEGRARTALAVVALLPLATYLVLNPAIVRISGPSDIRVRQGGEISRIVDSVTSPSQRIYVAAYDDGYQTYWLSHRDPATRWWFAEVMGASPYFYDRSYIGRVRRSLAHHPPAAIVVWPDSYAVTAHDYVAPAIRRGHLKQVADVEGVAIYARHGPRSGQ
jgi:4-amino-4-deoxy-L-arabinose transferase-like glycosyltransferase